MELNENQIRLSGIASIPCSLELGEDLTLGLTVNVYGSEDKNKEDGTFDRVYKLKPTGEILITKKWGKTPIKAKLRNSPQTRFRWALLQSHREQGIEEDFETWYDKYIDNEIAKLHQ